MGVLLSPLGLAILACLSEVLLAHRLPRWVRWCVRGLALVCLVLMTPWGANALVYQIEARVTDRETCQAEAWPKDTVLLSGGLLRLPHDVGDFSALTTSSLRRLSLALAVAARHPQTRLIVSGGGPHAIKEADVLADLALRLGVPPQQLVRESISSNTVESAQTLAHLPTAPLAHRVGVITSALHMPRALMAFEQQGLAPCAIPAYSNYLPSGGALGYYLPQSSALNKSEDALHELFGLMAYRARALLSPTVPPP